MTPELNPEQYFWLRDESKRRMTAAPIDEYAGEFVKAFLDSEEGRNLENWEIADRVEFVTKLVSWSSIDKSQGNYVIDVASLDLSIEHDSQLDQFILAFLETDEDLIHKLAGVTNLASADTPDFYMDRYRYSQYRKNKSQCDVTVRRIFSPNDGAGFINYQITYSRELELSAPYLSPGWLRKGATAQTPVRNMWDHPL